MNKQDKEQARLGKEAKEYYTAHLARHESRLGEFDVQMLSLFEAIENNESDIDQRIEKVHEIWKGENFWVRMLERAKLDMVWSAMAKRLTRREKETGESVALKQVQNNWSRVGRIGNRHWGGKERMATKWVLSYEPREL